ncbi:hypothetical protein RYX36_019519, partial [Vicia faba]
INRYYIATHLRCKQNKERVALTSHPIYTYHFPPIPSHTTLSPYIITISSLSFPSPQ